MTRTKASCLLLPRLSANPHASMDCSHTCIFVCTHSQMLHWTLLLHESLAVGSNCL